MLTLPIETSYPISFRAKDAVELARAIMRKQSVELVGMKRVGISNFLRFFLYNKQAKKKYFGSSSRLLFVPIDLNDLIERDIYPFWLLTFKRILDRLEDYPINEDIKEKINGLFDKAIQTKDHFLTLDSLRESLVRLVKAGVTPVLFFIRFDRIIESITPEFFANLQGLLDATHREHVYVFTSFRNLSELKPEVFDKNTTSVFSQMIYLSPAVDTDMEVIYTTLKRKYHLAVSTLLHQKILERCAGHVQYLHACLIALYDESKKTKSLQKDPLDVLYNDERIALQSDELFSSLTEQEKRVLCVVGSGAGISKSDREIARYLFDTGMIKTKNKRETIFSEFLQEYVEKQLKNNHSQISDEVYLTNKEHILFITLKNHEGTVCERQTIVQEVWSEYNEVGISDWAVDRLVARLRKKLSAMDSDYTIRTIRTRGFMFSKGKSR